ncbi:hypothetical protein [Stieleria mannarensis]|uniref:hypothetical protein n=1 Tax=Stieleria mannarensis TaxID=2755585 RepID=UPI001602F9A6|nr:hypothetical protein [Rhodopirellula sp. JC639]
MRFYAAIVLILAKDQKIGAADAVIWVTFPPLSPLIVVPKATETCKRLGGQRGISKIFPGRPAFTCTEPTA